MLIWSEKPQLVDLVCFAEMGRHDLVPFFDPTSKHSNVGHHSSVVVEIGVKHKGSEGVIGACHGPDGEHGNKKKRNGFSCQSFDVNRVSCEK